MTEHDLSVRPPNGDEDRAWLRELWRREWGGETMITRSRTHGVDDLDALIAVIGGKRVGAATWADDGAGRTELLSLNALKPGAGIGSALLEAVEHRAATRGSGRLWLITTNDNLAALRFYQRRGYRIAAIDAGAVDRARALKPSIPLTGNDGIPIHDEIELAKDLSVSRGSSS